MKTFDKNTKLEDLLAKGYGGLEALQILDMIKNKETPEDLAFMGEIESQLYNNK